LLKIDIIILAVLSSVTELTAFR